MKRSIEAWRATERKGQLNWMANSGPRKPIRAVSRRRARENRERAKLRPLVVGGPCEAQLAGCLGLATDWHERLSRARGGSITDTANGIGLCRACHSFVTEHPAWALEHGWLASQYGSWEVAG